MPLSEEIKAGINRGLYLVPRNLTAYNSTDNSISFSGAAFRGTTNEAIIGGDSAFVGTMTDLTKGRIRQMDSLPDTVITITDVNRVRIDYNNGGIWAIAINGPNIARTDNSGVSWTDQGTNLRGGGRVYEDMASWSPIPGNTQIVAKSQSTSALLDGDVSDDNGATWTAFSTELPGGSNQGAMVSDPEHKVLVALGQDGITTCFEDDVTVPGNWNVLDANTDFGVTSGWAAFAFSSDGEKFLASSVNGRLLSTEDFINWIEIPREDNPFWNATFASIGVDAIVHVDSLNGWLLFGNSSDGVVAFVPSNESPVNTIFTGGYLGDAINVTNRPGAASDGDDAIFTGSLNKVVGTLQAG